MGSGSFLTQAISVGRTDAGVRVLPERTETRFENACALTEELLAMIDACPSEDTLHLTWSMVRGSLASAIWYDASLLTWDQIELGASKLMTDLKSVLDLKKHHWILANVIRVDRLFV